MDLPVGRKWPDRSALCQSNRNLFRITITSSGERHDYTDRVALTLCGGGGSFSSVYESFGEGKSKLCILSLIAIARCGKEGVKGTLKCLGSLF